MKQSHNYKVNDFQNHCVDDDDDDDDDAKFSNVRIFLNLFKHPFVRFTFESIVLVCRRHGKIKKSTEVGGRWWLFKNYDVIPTSNLCYLIMSDLVELPTSKETFSVRIDPPNVLHYFPKISASFPNNAK